MEERYLFFILLLGAVFIVSAVMAFMAIDVLRGGKKSDVTEEIAAKVASLGLKDMAYTIRQQKCKSLEKVGGIWLIKDCKGDVYFKIFMDKGTFGGYCVDSSDKREIFKKAGKLLIPPQTCLNESLVDTRIIDEKREKLGLEVYNICGRYVIMRENCLIGVIR